MLSFLGGQRSADSAIIRNCIGGEVDVIHDDINDPSTSTSGEEPEVNGKRKRRVSPHRKISFADEYEGGHLEQVKLFQPETESIMPITPYEFHIDFFHLSRRRLRHLFQAPWSNPASLFARLKRNFVALETVNVSHISDYILTSGREVNVIVCGTIFVVNVSYDKSVFVRCTFDDWKSYVDVLAIYTERAPVGVLASGVGEGGYLLSRSDVDIFTFSIEVPRTIPCQSAEVDTDEETTGTSVSKMKIDGIEFAVCYEARYIDGWRRMWDNNDGDNYKFEYV